MSKPTVMYLGDKSNNSGIAVEYVKSRRMFNIHGWYDTYVGIEGDSFSLAHRLITFGITLNDCKTALKSIDE